MSKESEWCRLCGEHKKSHGKNLGTIVKRIDHEFKPVCNHSKAVYVENHASFCPDCEHLVIIAAPAKDYIPSGPQPEFPLDELVTKDVKEPKIEFKYGNCKICEIPLTEDYEHVSFCGDCAEDTWQIIMSGNKSEGNLPN